MAKKQDSKEVKSASKLNKELMADRRHGALHVGASELKKADKFSQGYKEYLDRGKTEREVVTYTIELAEKNGFVPYDRTKKYQAGDKVYYNNRGRALCLAVIGKQGVKKGVRMAAAHIDSPRIDLKPIPLYESNEIAMLKTHYYGGVKKYQWVAIPLSMHGKIVRKDGTEIEVSIGDRPEDPQFCITDILPHLGKDQNVKPLGEAIAGEDLNILAGSLPFNDEKEEKQYKLNVMHILNQMYGVDETDLICAELEFVPAFRATDVGFDRSMVGGYGQDDRVCAYPAVEAIFNCKNPEQTIITILADKEEIGSVGNTGMTCEFFHYFVADLAAAEGLEVRHVLTDSTCLSADVTAAFDPTYAYAYEAGNSCYLNHGVGVAKYTGSRGKGGCNDASAEFLAQLRKIFDDADVVWQIGELGKVDQGGGGTVAGQIARLNVEVIDVGVPVLSMHAPFEVVSKLDVYMTYRGIQAYFDAK